MFEEVRGVAVMFEGYLGVVCECVILCIYGDCGDEIGYLVKIVL